MTTASLYLNNRYGLVSGVSIRICAGLSDPHFYPNRRCFKSVACRLHPICKLINSLTSPWTSTVFLYNSIYNVVERLKYTFFYVFFVIFFVIVFLKWNILLIIIRSRSGLNIYYMINNEYASTDNRLVSCALKVIFRV